MTSESVDRGTLELTFSGLEDVIIYNTGFFGDVVDPKAVRNALAGMVYLNEKYGYGEGRTESRLELLKSRGKLGPGLFGIGNLLIAGMGYIGYNLYNAGAQIAGLTMMGVAAYKLATFNGTYGYLRKGVEGAKKFLKWLPVYSYFKKKGIEGVWDFLEDPKDEAFEVDNKLFLKNSVVSTLSTASAIELVNTGNIYLTALGVLMGAYGIYNAAKNGYLFASIRNKLKKNK